MHMVCYLPATIDYTERGGRILKGSQPQSSADQDGNIGDCPPRLSFANSPLREPVIVPPSEATSRGRQSSAVPTQGVRGEDRPGGGVESWVGRKGTARPPHAPAPAAQMSRYLREKPLTPNVQFHRSL